MLNRLLEQDKIIEVGMNYLTDDGVIIYRVWGKTTTYWVREDNFQAFMNAEDHLYAYRGVADAYLEERGQDIRTMRSTTAKCFLQGLMSARKDCR